MKPSIQSRRSFVAASIAASAAAGMVLSEILRMPALSKGRHLEPNPLKGLKLARAIFEEGNLTAARILIENGFDVTFPLPPVDDIPLPHVDYSSGLDPEMLEFLRREVAAATPILPIHLAIKSGNAQLLELLRWAEKERGIVRDLTFCPPEARELSLGGAASSDEWKRLNMAHTLIEYGIDLGAKDYNGDQALHWALRDRRTTLAQTLIDAGAPIDDPGSVGKTPLMLAVAWPLFAELLIKKGARVNYMTNNRTPLVCAALSGNLESTKLLLAAGAMPDLGAVMGRPLHEFLLNEDFVMGKDIRVQMLQLIHA